jgi:hypothetical protein
MHRIHEPNRDGDYSMFSTNTYEEMKRSTPELAGGDAGGV